MRRHRYGNAAGTCPVIGDDSSMNLKVRSTCAILMVLGMMSTGCANLGLATLNALLEDQTALDDDNPSDDVDDANGNVSDDDANGNDNTADDDGADDNDNATDDDGANDNDNATDDDSANLTRMDFSGFMQFAFSRTSGLGFCPPVNEVFSASIFVNADGSHLLNLSVLREGIAGLDTCIGTVVIPCATATHLEERTLTDDEVTAVAAAFSAVRVDDEADPICRTVAIDPCVIDKFAWDSFVVTDFECGVPRLRPDQADEIISLLEQLRSGR